MSGSHPGKNRLKFAFIGVFKNMKRDYNSEEAKKAKQLMSDGADYVKNNV